MALTIGAASVALVRRRSRRSRRRRSAPRRLRAARSSRPELRRWTLSRPRGRAQLPLVASSTAPRYRPFVTFALRLPARLNLIVVAAVLLGGALVAWVVTVARMRGMDDGPGTDLGGLGWYVGIWVTMMAAMMLPSVAPMVLLFARVSRER